MNPLKNSHSSETIPSLGFGTAAISSMRSYGSVMQLLNEAYEQGIRHFDTAPLYGRGFSEKLLGEFAKNKRPDLLIATKFGLGDPFHSRIPPRLALPLNYYRKKWRSPQHAISEPSIATAPTDLPHRTISLQEVKNSLEGSLQRLKTHYIDYYLLHEGLPGFLDPQALEFLMSQKQKGIIRHIGVATSGLHLEKVNSLDLQQWEILQYEAGPLYEKLKNKYPNKLHFLHSALKNIETWYEEPQIPTGERGGFLLAHHTRANGSGKVLFSTRRKKILNGNLQAFKKYSV